MENLDFTEEEIQEQLALLGYKNIPKHRLPEFKQDLEDLIRRVGWKSLASSTQINGKTQRATSQKSPPAFTKEKVSQSCFKSAGEGFFLHAGNADHNRQVLASCQNRDYVPPQGRYDSYSQHSVAPKLQLPPGAHRTLQVDQGLEDTLQSPLTDSYTSSPDTQGRRFIKRKVLRKHEGHAFVSDESVYSEDSDHALHTPQQECELTMYKTCSAQWEEESEDGKNSLSSSFWSDGDKEEEEEIEIERVVDSKPATNVQDSLWGASEEEKPELNNQGNFSSENLNERSNDKDEERCSSGPDSPAPSLMTSGYGTYRPEEPEGAEYRDDHTITEFDQDSQGDLSEMREDEEDNRSLSSFGDFLTGPTHEPVFNQAPPGVLEDKKCVSNIAFCRDGGPHEDMEVTAVKSGQEKKQADEKKRDRVREASGKNAPEKHHSEAEDALLLDEKQKQEKEVQDLHEEVEGQVEREDPDESSSNKDIKFIDSKVNVSWMTYDKMCEEWEGNLRQKKDVASHLEERLAQLRLSTSAQQDFEPGNEAVSDESDTQSSESDGVSLSAFESYMRGMTRTRSKGDLRPKPKSFIRPVVRHQTIKKCDPVAKYFQYKHLWEMFKVPGEKDRRALRWEIKEQLAYQPPPPKPQRVYVPNTYIVPTEKKRSALRWEIRNDLANGLLPHKFTFPF